jgi:hypothetical protein
MLHRAAISSLEAEAGETDRGASARRSVCPSASYLPGLVDAPIPLGLGAGDMVGS